MKKAPDAFRTISEVAEILETPAHVLRFWESKFYQIKPVKRAGGRRYYRPDDVALINGIRTLLQDQGMTIRGVQRVLQENGVKHVAALGADMPASEPDLSTVDSDHHVETVEDAHLLDQHDVDDVPAIAPVLAQDIAQQQNPIGAASQVSEVAPELDEVPLDSAMKSVPDDTTDVETADNVELPLDASDDAGDGAEMPPIAPGADQPSEPIVDIAAHEGEQIRPAVPVIELEALSDEETRQVSDRARIARSLRKMPRGKLGSKRDPLDRLGRRIDVLLERMSEASGAGRW